MTETKTNQIKRKWLLLMIFGPGIFFIVYWFAVQPGTQIDAEKTKPPQVYLTSDQAVSVDNITYQVVMADNPLNDTIHLKNNVAIAEPGTVFACVGLKTTPNIKPPDANLIDELGRQYTPLQLEQQLIVNNFPAAQPDVYLYLFKIPRQPESFYLQVHKQPALTWRLFDTAPQIPRPAQ